MNWGYKIIIVYVIFVAGILFLVIKASTQKTDLVTADYYAQELKYQDKIDQQKRSDALSAPVQFRIKDKQLIISFPEELKGKKIDGSVILYCPADENKDVKQNFSVLDTDLIVQIPEQNKGYHTLQLSWIVQGVNYYVEKKIFIG